MVRWREWGYEAFQEAREQGKPLAIFLTAFWCGFCQRMDEGALSHPEAIAILNAFFIPVRVEESQRPDVDLRYNQDGWPTIAFLTPDGDQLLSVNYMDPDPFVELLVRVVQLHQQGDLLRGESEAPDSQPLRMPEPAAEGGHTLGPALFYEVLGLVEGLADPVHGGFGDGFKFLHTDANDFFLYVYQATGERKYLDHVLHTLTKLRAGPMLDAPLGGFFRYSSKPDWSEPHREKLLYDQAALLRNYLYAYLLTGDAEWRVHAEGLFEFVESYLFDEEAGAYLGCQDYVAFDSPVPAEATHRQTRPVVDELVYCDANAVMVSACLDAWWLLGLAACRERAERVLETLWRRLRAEDGRMSTPKVSLLGRQPGHRGKVAWTSGGFRGNRAGLSLLGRQPGHWGKVAWTAGGLRGNWTGPLGRLRHTWRIRVPPAGGTVGKRHQAMAPAARRRDRRYQRGRAGEVVYPGGRDAPECQGRAVLSTVVVHRRGYGEHGDRGQGACTVYRLPLHPRSLRLRVWAGC